MCDMTHSYVWRDSFIGVVWRIHMCDMTHSYVRHDSFICETWLIHMWDMTHSYLLHNPCTCVTWLVHLWDVTRSYVWCVSFMYVTWLVHMCDMTRSYVKQHDSFTLVTWLVYTCDMTCHAPDIASPLFTATNAKLNFAIILYIYMNIHMYVCICVLFICYVCHGSLIVRQDSRASFCCLGNLPVLLHVSFRKRATNYRALLQRRISEAIQRAMHSSLLQEADNSNKYDPISHFHCD